MLSPCGCHNLKTLSSPVSPVLLSNPFFRFFCEKMRILEIVLFLTVQADYVRERWREILWRMNENANATYEIDARRKGKKGKAKKILKLVDKLQCRPLFRPDKNH